MTNRKPSQAQQILGHLQDGNEITAASAVDIYGCFRLAARIHELRQDGHQIIKRMERSHRDKSIRWAVYSLLSGS